MWVYPVNLRSMWKSWLFKNLLDNCLLIQYMIKVHTYFITNSDIIFLQGGSTELLQKLENLVPPSQRSPKFEKCFTIESMTMETKTFFITDFMKNLLASKKAALLQVPSDIGFVREAPAEQGQSSSSGGCISVSFGCCAIFCSENGAKF